MQALCKAAQFPPALLHFLLQPQQRSGQVSPALTRSGLPSGLQSALQRQHNPSQQAAIAAALDKQKGLISLIQVHTPAHALASMGSSTQATRM